MNRQDLLGMVAAGVVSECGCERVVFEPCTAFPDTYYLYVDGWYSGVQAVVTEDGGEVDIVRLETSQDVLSIRVSNMSLGMTVPLVVAFLKFVG